MLTGEQSKDKKERVRGERKQQFQRSILVQKKKQKKQSRFLPAKPMTIQCRAVKICCPKE